ncbi:peptidoglycan-binding domain-containing protein [Nocardiopsis exhalans]|uniref:Peptidoglycan-binding domain-containing protein n=1 Tax=Nocardiopsis exhalans TaxID=163604 RepID=A0ABY5D8M6_9ACTN|nr:peptidoglycan-binding domain-containing protein [Nocardiopsis exhalans]USY19735.1 peptidoglycan-binding domain-containing protein [Nocardiopsis exhalans]
MVNITNRSGWGARAPRNRSTTTWASRTGFTVHYSAGPPTQTPRQIQNFHMDTRGWADVGYNFLVDQAGNVYEGRGWLVVGAHAAPHNTSHIGVCFIGRDGDATPAAKAAIRGLYDEANRRAGKNLSRSWHGGLSGNSTSCPGADLRSWVRAGMPVSGGTTPAPTPPASARPGTTAPAWPGPILIQPPVRHTQTCRRWQTRMRERGWRITVDGWYGPASERVCRQFQTEKRLSVDGRVGPETWRASWEAPIT